ncbi:hypothetical protein SAMN05720766_11058 [Fibrobacter sp. UWH9]|uniref:hypothetical protein n=1 Tax=unclassified Fibrobacter TaxID=2634177 RepID=UPI0009121186|nr:MULTISPECIES: hypothetical protein [Fibrobacter]MCQ2101105.1 hypothetical protein [Fibrobacter sp.]MCL4103044.1 hypothetical protein [Fibrobacter succinogenes]MDO4947922.1 hypothetical protein [Fibrobacter sp.]OWV06420.1 hypothetical protein B7993_05710 [Fibrobacter sp. UWH3]OWV15037.1 hypothetical protein B7992_05835 [Fibrobacter sp. UWH1]
MDILSSLDYWFWTPIFAWVGLYRWFNRISYPTYFKSQMRKGQKWAYIPAWKGYWALCDKVFTLAAALLSALPAIWIVNRWTDSPWYMGFASSPLFLAVGFVLCRAAKNKTAKLYQSAYFLEYRKVRYKYEVKGNFRNEADVQNQTVWSYTKKLKNAEAHGRLWKYVNAMAKTKKIPPDIYAETMYV